MRVSVANRNEFTRPAIRGFFCILILYIKFIPREKLCAYLNLEALHLPIEKAHLKDQVAGVLSAPAKITNH